MGSALRRLGVTLCVVGVALVASPSAGRASQPTRSLRPRIGAFPSALDAWVATSQRVARTANAGRTWRDVTPARPGIVSGLFALDGSHAWVGMNRGDCAGVVWRTRDAGRHWTSTRIPARACDTQHLFFLDARVGWDEVSAGAAAGSEAVSIVATVDGGAHWRLVSSTGSLDGRVPPTPHALDRGCDKTGIVFSGRDRGFATFACAGGEPELGTTGDGGRTWATQSLPKPRGCDDGCFFEAAPPTVVHGVAVAATFTDADAQGPTTVFAANRVGTWQRLAAHRGAAQAVAIPDLDSWWIAIGDHLLVTNDGGAHWRRERPRLPAEIDRLVAVNAHTAWAIDGLGTTPGLARTVDGGRTWTPIEVAI
ncbi:MAG TPA: hypothetical protein VH914_22540 [Acidimicrobiia bacterium]|nr:hypothetical protein [Acidimicrobiia bacterium]